MEASHRWSINTINLPFSWSRKDPTGGSLSNIAYQADESDLAETTYMTVPDTNLWKLPSSPTVIDVTQEGLDTKTVSHGRRSWLWSITATVCLLILSTLLPSVLLISLIATRIVTPSYSIFGNGDHPSQSKHIFVNYSATNLTNISSFFSTIAPFLAGCVMALWSPCVIRSLQISSQAIPGMSSELPNAFQFSLLVAMCSALPSQLLKYFKCIFKDSRQQKHGSMPAILHKTAGVLLLSILLALLAFVADQVFHITTDTILLEQFRNTTASAHQFGRGLTERCLTINRAENYGLPCSWDFSLSTIDWDRAENEMTNLGTNSSSQSEIQFLTAPVLKHGDLATLLPRTDGLQSQLDFRSTTMGVSTQCQLITPKCTLKAIGDQYDTQFNCTDNFWGVLGKAPNTTTSLTEKAQDDDVPGMCWKPSPSLQYGFFADANLNIPYNTEGLDEKTGNGDPNLPVLPDDKLVNPVYLAVAGRFTTNDVALGSELKQDPRFQPGYKQMYFDFILNCSYTTYEIDYTRVEGLTHSFNFTRSPNGTAAEMWHGKQAYTALDGDPSDGLIDNVFLAAKQPTGDAFAKEWANLYSVRVLSVIGAYTSPRMNLQEQLRSQMLVAQISKIALGLLLSCSFAYVLMGLGLGGLAFRNSRREVYELVQDLDFNVQVTEKFKAVENASNGMSGSISDLEKNAGVVQDEQRVGVVGEKFGIVAPSDYR